MQLGQVCHSQLGLFQCYISVRSGSLHIVAVTSAIWHSHIKYSCITCVRPLQENAGRADVRWALLHNMADAPAAGLPAQPPAGVRSSTGAGASTGAVALFALAVNDPVQLNVSQLSIQELQAARHQYQLVTGATGAFPCTPVAATELTPAGSVAYNSAEVQQGCGSQTGDSKTVVALAGHLPAPEQGSAAVLQREQQRTALSGGNGGAGQHAPGVLNGSSQGPEKPVWVVVDAAHMGVGGDDSWSPSVHEEYLVPPAVYRLSLGVLPCAFQLQ
jgi:hypothetical protein